MVGWSMSAKTKWWTYSQVWWLNRRIFGLETRNSQKTRGDLRLLYVHPRLHHVLKRYNVEYFCRIDALNFKSSRSIESSATITAVTKWLFYNTNCRFYTMSILQKILPITWALIGLKLSRTTNQSCVCVSSTNKKNWLLSLSLGSHVLY